MYKTEEGLHIYKHRSALVSFHSLGFGAERFWVPLVTFVSIDLGLCGGNPRWREEMIFLNEISWHEIKS